MIIPQVSVTLAWPKVPSTSWLSSLVFPRLPQMKADGPEGQNTFHCFSEACMCCLLHMPLRPAKTPTCKGFPRALCRVQRRLCSGPPSWGNGAQSGAAFGNLAFSEQICMCCAVGLWEQCRNSSVALNAGGYLAVPCLLGRPWRLGLKGTFCGALQ